MSIKLLYNIKSINIVDLMVEEKINILNERLINQKWIGEKRQRAFAESSIYTIYDLLSYYPRKYIDRKTIIKIAQIENAEKEVTVIARLSSVLNIKKRGRDYVKAVFVDDSGILSCVWFSHAWYWVKKLKKNLTYIISGKADYFNGWSITHPILEELDLNETDNAIAMNNLINTGRIIPIYSVSAQFRTAGLENNNIRKIIFNILKKENAFFDIIPADILERNQLLPYDEAITNIHFAESYELKKAAIYRLKFEELFYMQLIVVKKKLNIGEIKKKYVIRDAGLHIKEIFNKLPFELTDAQKKVVKEIYDDLKGNEVMNRLVQGDVGSGKTVVALLAISIITAGGYQAAIMAPTEILAEQHYLNFKEICEGLDIEVILLKGKMRAKLKRERLEQIASGKAHIVIGTHAIIEDSVEFLNLGLVVIDEQHRFGVIQRGNLIKKGNMPNVLVMTATPIPRTLSLSMYGDLDVSIIDTLPRGRVPIITAIREIKQLAKVYSFIKKEIEEGRQAYIVYPLIEKSSKIDVSAAVDGFEKLKGIFGENNVGLLHGKMKSEEKEQVMSSFKSQEFSVLVSTTVIEVGVDVPNATIMLIMNSERFGLSQLHQLRGRVGRGSLQSYCILNVGDNVKDESLVRLEVLVKTSDGFEISEEDFKLRGPGEFFGKKQSGIPDFKIANLLYDYKIMKIARKEAFRLLKKDPWLDNSPRLRDFLNDTYKDKAEFIKIS